MPLPKPNKDSQEKKEFVNLCMDNLKMLNEFPDDKQRAAVCYSQWEKANANTEKKSDGTYEVDFSNQIKIKQQD